VGRICGGRLCGQGASCCGARVGLGEGEWVRSGRGLRRVCGGGGTRLVGDTDCRFALFDILGFFYRSHRKKSKVKSVVVFHYDGAEELEGRAARKGEDGDKKNR